MPQRRHKPFGGIKVLGQSREKSMMDTSRFFCDFGHEIKSLPNTWGSLRRDEETCTRCPNPRIAFSLEQKLTLPNVTYRPVAYLSGAVSKSLFSAKAPINGQNDPKTCMRGSQEVPQRNHKQFGGLNLISKNREKSMMYTPG